MSTTTLQSNLFIHVLLVWIGYITICLFSGPLVLIFHHGHEGPHCDLYCNDGVAAGPIGKHGASRTVEGQKELERENGGVKEENDTGEKAPIGCVIPTS